MTQKQYGATVVRLRKSWEDADVDLAYVDNSALIVQCGATRCEEDEESVQTNY